MRERDAIVEVVKFEVRRSEQEERPCYGTDPGPIGLRQPTPLHHARLDLLVDDEGLALLVAAVKRLVPDFRSDRAPNAGPRGLPSAALALKPGPIDAEFIDE